LIELKSARNEMHVCIIESRQKKLACGIDDARLRAPPAIHLCRSADGDNALIENRNCFCAGMIAIHSPDVGVGDDGFSGRMLLRRNDSTRQKN
jgi:hypothetical protein